MLGKFAVIFGPALMGLVGLMVKRVLMPPSPTAEQMMAIGQLASRWGIGSILLLFFIGGILFYFVDEEKGRQQAALLAADS
jgi:UMF1 family MFS transporter